MFNRSRKQKNPVRHSTYVRATDNLQQRAADSGLHNDNSNEASAEMDAQIYSPSERFYYDN